MHKITKNTANFATMKTLILLRHGKSEVHRFNESDFERNLTERGKMNASDMGKFISTQINTPDFIFTSSAHRTVETAQLIASALSYSLDDIATTNELYLASSNAILKTINTIPNRVNCCLLVGHNPGITHLINDFGIKIDNLPTCSALCFSFNEDNWQSISTNNAIFEWVKLARDL